MEEKELVLESRLCLCLSLHTHILNWCTGTEYLFNNLCANTTQNKLEGKNGMISSYD